MNDAAQTQLTEVFAALERGEPDAMGRLVEAVYPELKRLARYHLSRERKGHTQRTNIDQH